MKQWNLVLLKPELETLAGSSVFTVGWRGQTSEGHLQHLFAYKRVTPFDFTSSVLLYERLFAHFVLDQLPDQALPEILERLADAFVFYQPSKPEIEAPQKSPLKGKIARTYERPTYSLIDEE